jgi:hypothetical protein
MRLRIAPISAASVLALSCLNAWLLTMALARPEAPPEGSAVSFNPPSEPSALPPSTSKLKAITAYTRTLSEPVFYKSRVPYVAPPPAPPKAVAPVAQVPVDPGLALGGVVVAEQTKKAYIFRKADQGGAWLVEGEMIQGWKVELIETGAAKLRQGDRSIELHLYPKR